MTREDFLLRLTSGLAGNVPAAEAKRLVAYYDEMILDLMEDGATEEAAVAQVGHPNDLVFAAAGDLPPRTPAPTAPQHRWGLWLLVILGAPLWASLALAALCVLVSLDLLLWCAPLTGAAISVGCLLGGAIALVATPLAVSGTLALAVVELGASLLLLGVGTLGAWLTAQLARLCWRGHVALFSLLTTQFTRGKAVLA